MLKKGNRQAWLFAGALLSLSVPALAAPVVFGERATVKVRPSYAAKEDEGVSLVAARNEFVSFQVVVHGKDTGGKGVSAQVSDLKGPSTIGSSQVVVYRQALTNITTPSGGAGDKGMWPDGLIPDVDEVVKEKRNAFPFDVPSGQARALWMDILVPEGAEPGEYTGQVTVTGEGFSSQVPLRLSVTRATLPSTSSLPSAFLVFGNNACEAIKGSGDCGGANAQVQVLSQFETLALDHRVTLSNIFAVGQNGEDWASFDAAYAPFLNGQASTRLRGAQMTSAQITAQRNMSYFKSWAQHFREKNWSQKLYDYTGDEPPYGISFEEAKSRLQTVKNADPGIRTLLTTTVSAAAEHGLTDLIDIITPVVNHLDGTLAPYEGNQRTKYDSYLSKGNQLWSYQSCMSHGCAYGTEMPENAPGSGWPSYMVDRSAAKNRAMQWALYQYGVSGELYYETAAVLPNAWNSLYYYSGNGDGTLFYPGTPQVIGGTTPVPLPSLRLKHIRQGMQDYEWLKLVADAGDPGFAQKVVNDLMANAHSVPDDGEAFDAARLALIKRYAELTHDPSASVLPTVGGSATSNLSEGGSCSSTGKSLFPLAGVMAVLFLVVRARRQRAPEVLLRSKDPEKRK